MAMLRAELRPHMLLYTLLALGHLHLGDAHPQYCGDPTHGYLQFARPVRADYLLALVYIIPRCDIMPPTYPCLEHCC